MGRVQNGIERSQLAFSLRATIEQVEANLGQPESKRVIAASYNRS